MASAGAGHHGSILDREAMVPSFMALRSRLRQYEAPAEEAASAGQTEASGGGADGGVDAVVAEEFSVEELLDIEELLEVDKHCAELGHESAHGALPVGAEGEHTMSSDSNGVASVLVTNTDPHQINDLSLTYHDTEDLEWVSRIMDDSLADIPPPPELHAAALLAAARRPLEGEARASCSAMRRTPLQSICALPTGSLVPVKAKRNKRSGVSSWSAVSSSSLPLLRRQAADSLPLFRPSWHYFLHDDTPRAAKKKSKHGDHDNKSGGKPRKRGVEPTKHNRGSSAMAAQRCDRRCSHCGVQKTPQWRAGPEGAKTLCNACGVRYKSGRLFPEYRPACSPTFVSTIHSNFHRKVMDMRRRKQDGHGPVQEPVEPAAVVGLGSALASSLDVVGLF